MNRCLLDTAVFIYAWGVDHRYRQPCRAIIKAIADGKIEAAVTTQLVQEFCHVWLRRGTTTTDVVKRAKEIMVMCQPIPVEASDLQLAFDLIEDSPGVGMADLVHAACAINHGITTVVSSDSDFDRITSITRIDPADIQALTSLV